MNLSELWAFPAEPAPVRGQFEGETVVVAGYVGPAAPVGVAATRALVKLPAETGKRDAAGVRIEPTVAALAPTR